MERGMEGSQKKKVGLTEDISGGMRTAKKPKPKSKGNESSARFKMITERARKIRQGHPKMKWKNCVIQASKELYG
ncbi:MAG: hypothetical protein A2W91_05520 [Bacteroidetes bacterium GWF2_38_335]|nr:MAG: hypothetical protein A2W91_05520 [Bacteroidetes bacterium GWF2_38_335]HBS88097.1 hypothetical protein [Bacteroidales bacterium]